MIARLAEVPPGITSVEFARRSGVGRTTIHRIAAGTTEPTLGTLRELAIAHGLDLRLELVPLSDPHAAAAARHLVDPAFEGLAPADVSPDDAADVEAWIERLERFDDLDTAVISAARASSLLHRRGAVLLRGDRSAKRLASAGHASRGSWAVSGASALERITGAPVDGPSVLWVGRDAEAAASLLLDTHQRVENAAGATVIVAVAHPSVFVDAHVEDSLRYVAPNQLVLDAIGLGGALEASALFAQSSWFEDGVR